MSVANDRSMNAELREGASDGTIRKRNTGMRGGLVERTSDEMHTRLTDMGTGPSSYAEPFGEGTEALPAVVRR